MLYPLSYEGGVVSLPDYFEGFLIERSDRPSIVRV